MPTMILTKINTAPALDSFTPLAEHHSKTPDSFYQSNPVLYFHDKSARALLAKKHLSKLPINRFCTLDNGSESELSIDEVEIFVSSEKLTIFNSNSCIGYAIPYPAITLHAIQTLEDPKNPSQKTQGLYMEIEISETSNYEELEDDDINYIHLTLIPSPNPESTILSIQALFEAVSACSDLHPDSPSQEGDMLDNDNTDSRIILEGDIEHEGINGLPGVFRGALDHGYPPPFPGSSGWITAENISEYVDKDGNWIDDNNNDDKMNLG